MAQILKHDIDVSQIAPWAKVRLSQEAREREEKKRQKEEKKRPWKAGKSVIAVGKYEACVISGVDYGIHCWQSSNSYVVRNSDNLGKVKSIALSQFELWGINIDDLLVFKKEVDPQLRDIKILDFALDPDFPWLLVLRIDGRIVITHISSFGDTYYFDPKLPGRYSKFAVWGYYLCAITQDADLKCWENENGYFGLPTPTNLGLVKDVYVGLGHVYVLGQDNSLKCFYVQSAQAKSCSIPSEIGLIEIASIGLLSCIIQKFDGRLRCWRYDHKMTEEVEAINQSMKFIALSSSPYNKCVCAVEQSGQVKCFGSECGSIAEVPEGLTVAVD